MTVDRSGERRLFEGGVAVKEINTIVAMVPVAYSLVREVEGPPPLGQEIGPGPRIGCDAVGANVTYILCS